MKKYMKNFFIILLFIVNIPIILIPTSILLPDLYHIIHYNDGNISSAYIISFLSIYFVTLGVIFYSLFKMNISKKYLLLLLFQYTWFLFYFLSTYILFWINYFEKEVSNISQTFWITCLLLIDYFLIKKFINNKKMEKFSLYLFLIFLIYLIWSYLTL